MLILRHDEQGCHAVHAHVLTWISMVLIIKLDLVFKSGTLLHFSWRIVVVYLMLICTLADSRE